MQCSAVDKIGVEIEVYVKERKRNSVLIIHSQMVGVVDWLPRLCLNQALDQSSILEPRLVNSPES